MKKQTDRDVQQHSKGGRGDFEEERFEQKEDKHVNE